ncbi:flagellar biosynthetic protein FliO [Salinibius halmophilus]|uniref:flagellar biosynthetic protein FliO n=1 Tax=Salinibius halmophilus TaxID=1853216 RepID=UPI000E665AC0|nr:flagellar biosynthetic protein FliO [Salinibius halmophilus]
MTQANEAMNTIVPTSELASVFFSLLLIIGLIFALAWLVRRFGGATGASSSSSMKVIASLSLGAKEKLLVVQVGDEQFLLGVTPQSINKIDKVNLAITPNAPINFADKLQELLQKNGRSNSSSLVDTTDTDHTK